MSFFEPLMIHLPYYYSTILKKVDGSRKNRTRDFFPLILNHLWESVKKGRREKGDLFFPELGKPRSCIPYLPLLLTVGGGTFMWLSIIWT